MHPLPRRLILNVGYTKDLRPQGSYLWGNVLKMSLEGWEVSSFNVTVSIETFNSPSMYKPCGTHSMVVQGALGYGFSLLNPYTDNHCNQAYWEKFKWAHKFKDTWSWCVVTVAMLIYNSAKYIILQPAVGAEILTRTLSGRQQVIECPPRSKRTSESRTDETQTRPKRQRRLLV